MAETLLTIVHVFLFVAWLGIDVGVFTSSFVVRKPGLSPDARVEIRRIMRGLDLAPRLSLVLMVPTALWLARSAGFAPGVPVGVAAAATAVVVVWAVAIVGAYREVDPLGRPSGVRRFAWLPRVDLWLRLVTIAFFVSTGLHALLADGLWRGHVAWKALLFGLTVCGGLWIRSAAAGFAPALRATVEQGETPELLATMDRAMHRTYPAVLSVWAGVAALAVIGLANP